MLTASEKVEALSRSALFGALETAVLTELASALDQRSLPADTTVIVQGEPGDQLFVIVSGLVKVVRHSASGDVIELVRLKAGDCFGELAVLDGGVRTASVQTVNVTTLLAVTRERLLRLMAEHPVVIGPLLSQLAAMVRGAADREADRAFLGLRDRLARRLLELHGASSADPAIRVTQTELAQMLGASRQRVNQALHDLAGLGLVRLDGSAILVPSPPDLAASIA